ncbi:hypothetical protein H6F74_24890 [Trichocoleus sp. FACHB-90]|uniref:ParM/StbA family protein n=1 Tax=Cyanophyceae TaxID=3028117 RepID=UPI0016855822|nr:hypothetical protein [Trichocoleus sp. FACHB-90]MBD1929454.1 hypothetical protein [Trichocoleus sp. FACHB-90]
MVTMQPTQAELTRSTPAIAVGVDNGAGLCKLVFGSGNQQMKVRTPSKVLEIKEELHDILTSKEGGHFFYHSGDREDLIGREFLTRTLAAWKAPTTHIKLSDDPVLKVEYALHTLLGGLSTLPSRQEWNLHLVLSIHNKQVFQAPLIKRTSGTHVISFNGKNTVQSRINLKVSLVAPEGAGSYSYCVSSKPEPLIDRTAHAIAFDFGTSTVIPTVFAPGGAIIHRQVLEVGGCIDLLDAIATDSELIHFLGSGKAGNIETIRQAIESGSFQYGTRNFNLRSVYARHLKPWLSDRLRLALKEIQEWRDSAQSFVAWGGGVEMPGVAKMLATQGITAVPDGCWANAIGLQRVSQGRLARGK